MIAEKSPTQEMVNNLSERLEVRAITKPRMYRLCRTGEVDYGTFNEATNMPGVKRNPHYDIEGRELIFDIGEKEGRKANKYIENVVALIPEEQPDGTMRLKKKIEGIEFINGICVVFPREYNKLVRMERSNYYKNNPFRDESKVAIWELVDEEKSKEEIIREKELRADAVVIAKSMTSEEARSYANKLDMPDLTKASISDVKLFLIGKAEENPESFIQGSFDVKAKLKLNLIDAKKIGVIVFDADKSKWILNYPIPADAKLKRVKAKELVAVRADQIPDEVLFDYFIDKKDSPDHKVMIDGIKNPQNYI